MHERKNSEQNLEPTRINSLSNNWPHHRQQSPFKEEAEYNLLDYWKVLKRRKWQIFLITILCTALGGLASFIMQKKYKAEASLMPIASRGASGGSGISSQIGSLSLLGGALGDISKLGSGKTKELINILKSSSLSEKVILRYDLIKIIFAKQYDVKTGTFFEKFLKPIPVMEDAVKVFKKKIVKVQEEKKTGLILIEVTMKDPVLAAQVANRMVLELQDFIQNNSLTVAKRNRIFLEEQLVKTRAKLIEAGKELNQFYADNRISSVVPQIDVSVGAYSQNLKSFAEFREEYQDLEASVKQAESEKEQAIIRRVPGQVFLQFLQLNRELVGKTYGLLLQQYELAKIEEAKEELAFQVIDKAQVKVRPDSPKPVLNVAIGFCAGLFLAVMLAFFRDYIERMKAKEAYS